MKLYDRSITTISSILTGIISIIIAVSIPASYFLLTYKYIGGAINAELVVSAQTVEGFVIRNPHSWQFEEIRLREMLERKIDLSSHDNKTIRDLRGNVIAEIREPLKSPVVRFSEPIYDSGIEVARIEIERSIAPLYYRTAFIGVFSSLLGIIIFLAFYFFRLRTLQDNYVKLQESERQYKLITEKMTDIVWIADMNLRTLYISPSVRTVLGFNQEELPETVEKLMTPESWAIAMETLAGELALEEQGHRDPDRIVTLTLEYYHKDCSTRWMETIMSGLRNDRGVATGIHGVSRNITERKRMEESLQKSEEKYRQLAETTHDIIVTADFDFKITYGNKSAANITGGLDLVGMNLLDFTSPDMHELQKAIMQKRREGFSDMLSFEWEINYPVGTIRTFDIKGSLLTDYGKPSGAMFVAHDITDRKQAENALRESERQYKLITEKMTDIVWIANEDLRTIYVTPSIQTVLGFSQEERMQQTVDQQFTPESLSIAMETLAREIAIEEQGNGDPNRIVTLALEYYHKGGSTRWMETIMSGLRNDQGVAIGIHGVSRDITEHKLVDEKLRKSEELYTRLVNTIPDIIIQTDLEGNIIFISDYALKISGYTREEIEGRNILTFISPDDQSQLIQNAFLMIEGRIGPKEYHMIIKDGRIVPFEVNSDVLRNQDGTPFGIVSVVRDISERKRTERLLRDKEERLRGITENLPGVIFQFYAKDSGEYGVNYISEPIDEFSKIMTNEETANLDIAFPSFLSRIHEEDRARFLASIEIAVEKKSSWNFEGRILRSGRVIWFQGLSTPTRFEDKTVFNGILLNITERKLAEENSRKSEEKFRKIFMTTPNAISLTRMSDGLVIDVNKGFEEITGFKREQVIGKKSTKSFVDFWVNPSERDSMVAELKAGKDILHREFKFRRSDGSLRDGIYSARSINIDNEKCLIFIMQDMTERKQAEEKFFKIFMTTPDCIGITRLKDGLIIDGNKGFEDIIGWELKEVIGTKSTELPMNFWVDLSARNFMVDQFKAGKDIMHREFEFRRKDGSVRDGIYSTRPINIDGEACLIFILQDITEQKRMERELAASQKVKLMGQITSGVAHEVRNPLHAIQAISEAMALDMDEKSDYKEYLMHIKAQVKRLSHLMNDLLDLGKPIQPSQFSRALLTEIVAAALKSWMEAHPRLSQQVKVVNNLQPDDFVLVDTNKIQQVIINLMENASQHSPKDEEILLTLGKSSENYVMVKVIDKGEGLNPQDQPRVFEPFYTTRKSGTGLGLSICKHIIESHGGSIDIVNNKNAPGCTAQFIIPVYKGA